MPVNTWEKVVDKRLRAFFGFPGDEATNSFADFDSSAWICATTIAKWAQPQVEREISEEVLRQLIDDFDARWARKPEQKSVDEFIRKYRDEMPEISGDNDWESLVYRGDAKSNLMQNGAVVYFDLWTGWLSHCSGDITMHHYAIVFGVACAASKVLPTGEGSARDKFCHLACFLKEYSERRAYEARRKELLPPASKDTSGSKLLPASKDDRDSNPRKFRVEKKKKKMDKKNSFGNEGRKGKRRHRTTRKKINKERVRL